MGSGGGTGEASHQLTQKEIREYDKKVREQTARLKDVKEGTALQNIRSKIVATVTKRINRNHPYVSVTYRQRRGRHKGTRRNTAWYVDNVRIVRR